MTEANVDFSQFVISLAQGVMLGLGEVPDPETQKTNQNLELAQHSLGVLQMLREKTVGNLDDEEENLIEALLRDLGEKFKLAKSS